MQKRDFERSEWTLVAEKDDLGTEVGSAKAVEAVYELTDESLELEATMVEKLKMLSSAEFERVLHPVFEEDEWTLIATGTVLGGIAGAAQAAL